MVVDRARFLALVPLLAACGEPRPSPAVAPRPPPEPMPVASVSATATATVPSAAPVEAASSVVDDAVVPECLDHGIPGPTCEQGFDPVVECLRVRQTLRPRAARAAVECMNDRGGGCAAHERGAAASCFLGSFSSAVTDPSARAKCAPIVAKCGAAIGLDECVAGVSAVVDAARAKFISCVAEGCSLGCFDSTDLMPPPSRPVAVAKAKPRDLSAKLAEWPTVSAKLPADWTRCKLTTDCTVVPTSGCGAVAVSRSAAPLVAERARREHASKPSNTRNRLCAGVGSATCTAGACVVVER